MKSSEMLVKVLCSPAAFFEHNLFIMSYFVAVRVEWTFSQSIVEKVKVFTSLPFDFSIFEKVRVIKIGHFIIL